MNKILDNLYLALPTFLPLSFCPEYSSEKNPEVMTSEHDEPKNMLLSSTVTDFK